MDVQIDGQTIVLFKSNSCVCCREYEIEILDREFDPPIIVIQEGDRVWWYWDKDKVKSSQWSPQKVLLFLLLKAIIDASLHGLPIVLVM